MKRKVDLFEYNDNDGVGRLRTTTPSQEIAIAEKLEANMMTKAQFNALAAERKANRAGSGFDEWGAGGPSNNINYGLHTWIYNNVSYVSLGRETDLQGGISKTLYAKVNINGENIKLGGVAHNGVAVNNNRLDITSPTAPTIYPHDTVLTAEQINSGVIKHAGASNSGLIVNGKFDTDTSGWINYVGGSISQVSGRLKTQSISDRGRGYQYLTNLVVGKKYVVEAMVASDGVVEAGLYCSSTNNVGAFDYGVLKATISETTLVYKKLEFTATTTNLMLCCTTISSGVSSSYSYFDNIAVYPADAISRSDLVFLESWHEDVSEKNFVYPLGNVQYLGGNTDGLTGIANGSFSGYETYSLFGNWQTPSALIGKGYVWSSLTEAQKKTFIANPENNCYLDGDKIIQVRYRVRVVQGWGDDWRFGTDVTRSYIAPDYGRMCFNTIENSVKVKGKLTNVLDISTRAGNEYISIPQSGMAPIGQFTNYLVGGSSPDTGSMVAYEGKCFALPIAIVHRRNQGMYHPVYNPNGSKKASDGNFWYNTAVSFTSISDCFDTTKLLTASGYIGSVSGRPDGVFYNQVHESDITDLRNSSKKVEDYNRLIGREFNKLVAGTTRGKEASMELKNYLTSTVNMKSQYIYPFGACTYVKLNTVPPSGFSQEVYLDDSFTIFIKGDTKWYRAVSASTVNNNIILHPMYGNVTADFTVANSIDVLFIKKSTRTKSNTLLHCDIIGNPSNYPTAWKESGVFGTPLIVAEDGTSLLPDGVKDSFKLSRKANATPLLCLRSTDNGVTWTSFTPTFSTTTNEITLTDEPAGNLVMVYYQTKTTMATPTVNSEVLEIGEAFESSIHYSQLGGSLCGTLLNKVATSSVSPNRLVLGKVYGNSLNTEFKLDTGNDYKPTNNILNLGNTNTPTYKVFPYLTRLNGKAYLNLVFKEMKHNGTSWGDDAKFNIVDNVSTTTDNNAQTVLIGQKTVELPYFIGADE